MYYPFISRVLMVFIIGFVLVGIAPNAPYAQIDRTGLSDEFDSPIPPESYFRNTKNYFGGLVPGAGREETFYAFDGCMKIDWILKQRKTRSEWLVAIQGLKAECDLDPVGSSEYNLSLNYLAANYGAGSD